MKNLYCFCFVFITTIVLSQDINYGQKLNHTVKGEPIFIETQVDVKPKLMYGENGMYRFMSRNFKFPKNEVAVKQIVCSFIVELDGSITDIKVVNKVPDNFSAEAIRVMTKFDEPWYPALKDNKQVRCQYILPIIIDRI
jgi:hypothetical protein